MLDSELLGMLCCPETRQGLSLADAACLGRINEAIGAGRACNPAGHLIQKPCAGALIRADGRVAYPIRNGIPVMLVEEAVLIEHNLSL